MSLFIGGPADGEHRKVYDGRPVWRIREMPPLPPLGWTQPQEVVTLKCIDHDYRYVTLTGGGHVYLHESLFPSQILDILLSGYRNPDSPFKRP